MCWLWRERDRYEKTVLAKAILDGSIFSVLNNLRDVNECTFRESSLGDD